MMISLLFALSFAHADPLPSCGSRLMAFNVYEQVVNNRIVEKHSVFEVGDWSDSSAFDGVVMKNSEDAALVLEVETRRNASGKPLSSKQYEFSPWESDPAYRTARHFDPREAFRAISHKGGAFVFRLLKNKTSQCEDLYVIAREEED
ncbi:MAG: hypothetical protein KF865_04145 [Bdellovibrionaceae bacterium]|nr:hypothetical protein [Pseudobdellovibrionaceae bacterium]